MPADAVPRKDPFGIAGTLLDGRFRIQREVAEGGFGVVYYATQVALDRPVAIKILKTPSGFDEEAKIQFRDRFASEGKTIARIRHPHIVDVYDFGVSQMPSGEIAPWMALEWLDGQTLEEQLFARRGQGGQSPADVLATFRPVLQAFSFAHKQGIAHRDIKPANIMAVPSDHGVMMRVLDFGIAKVVSPDEAAGSGHTKTGGIPAFSPLYAAPEQIAFGRTGPWTDVHALGLILTEFLTDQAPYKADDIQIFEQIIATERPTPRTKGVEVGAWEPVLRKALALSPSERWRSAGELLAALDANVGRPEDGVVVAGIRDASSAARVPAPPPEGSSWGMAPLPVAPAPQGVAPPPARGPRTVRLIAGGAIALAIVGGTVFALHGSGDAKRQMAATPAPAATPKPAPATAPPPAPSAVPAGAVVPGPAPAPGQAAASAAIATAAEDPTHDLARIEVRTDPPTARLSIDHHDVHNPYSVKLPRSRRLHDVVATLPGLGQVHEMIAFDRDRDLVLKLGAVPTAPARAEVAPSPPASPAPRAEPAASPTGYRGSKLKIETEFP